MATPKRKKRGKRGKKPLKFRPPTEKQIKEVRRTFQKSEFAKTLKKALEETRRSQMITAADLAIVINCRD